MISPLLDRVQASELTAISKRPEALPLVMPAITAILNDVASDAATDSNKAATALKVPHLLGFANKLCRATVSDAGLPVKKLPSLVMQVLQALANTVPRRLLEATVLPVVASALQRGSVPMQLACLELALLNKLQAAVSLAALLRYVLPAILSVVVGDDRPAASQSAVSSAAAQVNRGPLNIGPPLAKRLKNAHAKVWSCIAHPHTGKGTCGYI